MRKFFKNFIRDEQGQDMIEYTLLLAFICLAGVATFSAINGDLSAIWGDAKTTADSAKTAAS